MLLFILAKNVKINTMITEITIGKDNKRSCFNEVLKEYDLSARQIESLDDPLEKGDILFIQGNIDSKNTDTLKQIKKLSRGGIHAILSIRTDIMKKAVSTKPFLICPYTEDLEASCHTRIRNENDAMRILVNMHDHSHGNILMPYKDMMLFVCKDGRQFKTCLPYGEAVDNTYADESMIGGFIKEYLETADYVKMFHYTVCAYSVSTHTGKPAGIKEIHDAYEMMKEKQLWMK